MRKYTQETVASQVTQPPDWLAIGTIVADVLVTCIVIAGMWIDKYSVTIAVLSGVTFFILFGALVILVLSGTLTEVVVNRQQQVTIRQLHHFQYRAQMQRVEVVDSPRLPSIPSAPPMQLPSAPTFVSAIPRIGDTTRVDASNFVVQLFDTSNGRPLPSKITKNKGQIQHKSPTPEAVEYLVSLGIVRAPDGKQLYWDGDTYPTLHDALNAIRSGRRPSYQEGREGREEGLVGHSYSGSERMPA